MSLQNPLSPPLALPLQLPLNSRSSTVYVPPVGTQAWDSGQTWDSGVLWS